MSISIASYGSSENGMNGKLVIITLPNPGHATTAVGPTC